MNRKQFLTVAMGAGALLAVSAAPVSAATFSVDAWASVLSSIAKLAGLGWAWQITSDAGAAIVALPEVPGHRRIELRGPAEAIPGMLQKALLQRYEEVRG